MADARQLIIHTLFFHSQGSRLSDVIIVVVGQQGIINRPTILQRRREMRDVTGDPFSRSLRVVGHLRHNLLLSGKYTQVSRIHQ